MRYSQEKDNLMQVLRLLQADSKGFYPVKWILFFLMVFSSGCNHYSEIDAENRDSKFLIFGNYTISYELPRGYQERKAKNANESLLADYHYDNRAGPTVYTNSHWGDTQVSISVFSSTEANTQAFVENQLNTNLVGCVYDGDFDGWEKIICEDDYLNQIFIKKLPPNNYMYFSGRVLYSAYEKEHIRAARINLIDDILTTIKINEP